MKKPYQTITLLLVVSILATALFTSTVLSLNANESPPLPSTGERLDLTPEDVAWATGWNIVKAECPSGPYKGMQIVGLDDKGRVIAGDGTTLLFNHDPDSSKLPIIRVAFKVDGKSAHGRLSDGFVSGKFHLPDVFLVQSHSYFRSPNFEDGILVLAEEYEKGKSTRSPAIRQLAVRLVKEY